MLFCVLLAAVGVRCVCFPPVALDGGSGSGSGSGSAAPDGAGRGRRQDTRQVSCDTLSRTVRAHSVLPPLLLLPLLARALRQCRAPSAGHSARAASTLAVLCAHPLLSLLRLSALPLASAAATA